MAHLYANENFPLPVVVELRRLGHDVLTTLDAGKSGQAIQDDEVLSFASTEPRAVLTHNRKHFLRLHRVAPDYSGIVICTFDPDFLRQAQRIHEALADRSHCNKELLRVYRPA